MGNRENLTTWLSMMQCLMVNCSSLLHLRLMLEMTDSDNIGPPDCFGLGFEMEPTIDNDEVKLPRYLMYFLMSPGPITAVFHKVGSLITLSSLDPVKASAKLRMSTP